MCGPARAPNCEACSAPARAAKHGAGARRRSIADGTGPSGAAAAALKAAADDTTSDLHAPALCRAAMVGVKAARAVAQTRAR